MADSITVGAGISRAELASVLKARDLGGRIDVTSFNDLAQRFAPAPPFPPPERYMSFSTLTAEQVQLLNEKMVEEAIAGATSIAGVAFIGASSEEKAATAKDAVDAVIAAHKAALQAVGVSIVGSTISFVSTPSSAA